MKSDLKNAIELDGTNANAFNSLGIRMVDEAVAELKKGNFDGAKLLMREAISEFKLAGALDSSLEGTHKYVNNVTWCNYLLFQGFLNKEGAESKNILILLDTLNYTSADDFFDHSRKELEIYRKIAPNFPASLETGAQSMFLEAQYKRSQAGIGTQNPQKLEMEAADLESRGRDLFAEAIEKRLYERVKTKKDALDQFDLDFLHQYFIQQNPTYAKTLRDRIDTWWQANME